MDEPEVLTLINSEHKKSLETCSERFVATRLAFRVLWVAIAFGVGLLCTNVSWAITSASNQSKLVTTMDQHSKDIKDLQIMSSKIDEVLKILQEMKK
jgi:hypothetical protein